MKYKKKFCTLWLILGLLEVLLSGGPASADGLLSTGSNTSDPSADETLGKPVRVPRAFFEQPLAGSVAVDGRNVIAWASINWIEQPPTAAPPSGTVYGDFRERKGCAIFMNEAGLQLCFNVVPDISSLGVNADEIKLEGTCSGNVATARFLKASFNDGKLSASFEAGCGGLPQIIDLTLQTRG